MTSRKADSGQRIEDSPPTLRLRRIYVAADPWSANNCSCKACFAK